jgi:signal transduction histidine kinase
MDKRETHITDEPPNYQRLMEAFELFNRTSIQLQKSYEELQIEARRLSEELAETNAELGRNLAEKQRVKSYLKNILENLPTGVLVISQEGFVTIINPVVYQLLPLAGEGNAMNESYQSLPFPAELKHAIHLALKKSPEYVEDYEIHIRQAIPAASALSLAISTSPLGSRSTEEDGVIVILKDISRLKELEARNQRAQRLQAMGEMAIQLAHEIRNPLGSIELFASLIRQEVDKGDDISKWAAQVVTGVKFLNTIVTNMLAFSRGGDPQFSKINLLELIHSTLVFLEPVLQQREVQIVCPMEDPEAEIEADPEMLRQMLMNLLMNAMQAMPARGKLTFRLSSPTLSTLCLEVEDTGIGIATDNLERIFDPFFTTNERGTGLGLALVHQIVKKHDGQVEVKSQPGCGTCFSIQFPKIHETSAPCAQSTHACCESHWISGQSRNEIPLQSAKIC